MTRDDIMFFSGIQFEKAYYKILERITLGFETVLNPTALILGGQPGAGKTTSLLKERYGQQKCR